MFKCENIGCTDRSIFSEEQYQQHITFEHKSHELVRRLVSLDSDSMTSTDPIMNHLRSTEQDFLDGIFRFPCLHVCEESGKACKIACFSPLALILHQKQHIKMAPSKRFPNHGVFSPRPKLMCPLQCLVFDKEACGVCLHVCKDELSLEVHRSKHINGISFTDLIDPPEVITPRPMLHCSHQKCKLQLFLNQRELDLHNDYCAGVYHFRCDQPCTQSGKECGLAFQGPTELIRHELQHRDWSLINPNNVKCVDCDATFWGKALRNVHRQQIHPQKLARGRAQQIKDDAIAKQKYAANENLRIAKSLRSSLVHFFDTPSKVRESTIKQLISVSLEEARAHLNNNDNGLQVGDIGVHIDHIRPISSFDLKRCKMEIMQCFSIFNLQLMNRRDARAKSKKTFNDADRFKYVPIQAKLATLRPAWLQDGKCTCGTCE